MKVVSQEHFLYFGGCSWLPEWRKETPNGTGVETKTLKIIEGFLSKYSAISVTFNSLSIWNKGDLSGTFNWLLEGIPDSMNEDHELKMGLESSPRPWDSFKKGIISKYLNSSETLNNLSLWNKGYQSETFPSLWMIFLTPWGDIRNSKMGLEKSQKH